MHRADTPVHENVVQLQEATKARQTNEAANLMKLAESRRGKDVDLISWSCPGLICHVVAEGGAWCATYDDLASPCSNHGKLSTPARL